MALICGDYREGTIVDLKDLSCGEGRALTCGDHHEGTNRDLSDCVDLRGLS